MYVCICKGVTDRDIQDAVEAGCSSMSALKTELGVATGCRKCTGYAHGVLDDALEKTASKPVTVGYFEPQPAV